MTVLALMLAIPISPSPLNQADKPKPVPLVQISAAINRLVRRLDEIEATAEPALFKRHLRSVRALVRAEEGRAAVYSGTPHDITAETLKFVQQMQRGFDADAAKWESYLNGRRSLVMAYVSPRDHSIAHYGLTLPKEWKPDTAYPLVFELHGASDTNPLSWNAAQVGLPEGVSAEVYDRPAMIPMQERKGVHVYPFGRGNSGYVDIGETDVWEALADAEKTVRLDPDRYYLYGFSMGGGGTWQLATREPDRWAAAAILAPAPKGFETDRATGVARNVANLPLWMWIGDKDFLLPYAHGIRDELAKYKIPLVYTEAPGVGHEFRGEAQTAAMRFFDGKVRQRPLHFAYVAHTDRHFGAWGVTLVRDLSMSGAPNFECWISGSSVRLESIGTPGLTLDLSAMGLKGEVVVSWNGKEAYRGEPKVVGVGVVPEKGQF
ncbi:hypothetical protein EON81_06620 [bacterium]|nr:MAG: hypothetical protein EON81_06620 [bacterium]